MKTDVSMLTPCTLMSSFIGRGMDRHYWWHLLMCRLLKVSKSIHWAHTGGEQTALNVPSFVVVKESVTLNSLSIICNTPGIAIYHHLTERKKTEVIDGHTCSPSISPPTKPATFNGDRVSTSKRHWWTVPLYTPTYSHQLLFTQTTAASVQVLYSQNGSLCFNPH